MENKGYSNFAFISYSHRDMAVAKWLQKNLERFKLPTEIHNEIDANSRYLRPVFRDQSDLNAGILGEELRKNLENSKFLILICSKDSAKSQWVSDEAKAFVEMGRLVRIIPVMIPDGKTPERELFPIFLREYFEKNPDKELLGINIRETGKEKTLIRVVSSMLDVSFDSLWKRHLRHKRVRIIISSAIAAVAVVGTYIFAIPISVSIDVGMEKASLPVGDNVTIRVDGAEYLSDVANPRFDRITIPGYKRFANIPISVSSKFYTIIDTVVPVGFGIRRDISLELKRDDTFAKYAGNVYDADMEPLQNVNVTVSNRMTTTDSEGFFSITLPLVDQKEELAISLEKEGYKSITRNDEPPGEKLKFIMHR